MVKHNIFSMMFLTMFVISFLSNNVSNYIDQIRNVKKEILFCKKCKRIRFYHSLKTQVAYKNIFEIKNKEETKQKKEYVI